MISLINHDSRVRENSEVVIICPRIRTDHKKKPRTHDSKKIISVQCGAPKIAKLVYNSNNYGLWYLYVLITIVMGVYKPTYNWGAPHCSNMSIATIGCKLGPSPAVHHLQFRWSASNCNQGLRLLPSVSTVMAIRTSYKWLFLWDYTVYKRGYKYL